MAALVPPPLQSGNTIGVMAPSSYVERDNIEASKTVLESLGYEVFIHPQTYARHHQSAGTTHDKLSAFHDLWARPDIHAVWMAGGGNRALYMLPHLDYDLIRAHPKPLIGFSDGTALLNAVTARAGLVTTHANLFKNLHKSAVLTETLSLLSGAPVSMPLEQATVIQNGTVSGPLAGGCLSLFHLLCGTPYAPPLEGAILFLEDSGDHISRYDRMLADMALHGVFQKISGLILGEFHDMQDSARPFGYSLTDCILEGIAGRNIPVLSNAPFGHGPHRFPLSVGGQATLDTTARLLRY